MPILVYFGFEIESLEIESLEIEAPKIIPFLILILALFPYWQKFFFTQLDFFFMGYSMDFIVWIISLFHLFTWFTWFKLLVSRLFDFVIFLFFQAIVSWFIFVFYPTGPSRSNLKILMLLGFLESYFLLVSKSKCACSFTNLKPAKCFEFLEPRILNLIIIRSSYRNETILQEQ